MKNAITAIGFLSLVFMGSNALAENPRWGQFIAPGYPYEGKIQIPFSKDIVSIVKLIPPPCRRGSPCPANPGPTTSMVIHTLLTDPHLVLIPRKSELNTMIGGIVSDANLEFLFEEAKKNNGFLGANMSVQVMTYWHNNQEQSPPSCDEELIQNLTIEIPTPFTKTLRFSHSERRLISRRNGECSNP